MEDFLIALLQFLLETLLEIISNGPIGWCEPPLNRKTKGADGYIGWALLMFLLGCGLGAVSVWLFGHSFIHHSALRIANLIIAPILSGFFAYRLAHYRRYANSRIIPRHRFWYAFSFTFGMVLSRFLWASHQG